ncbi:MAG: GntR family transcriptional regulator [Lachnospiraceae bacterium]|nr:GntR family transcriptional regulator [Lachnospiraceae bacterium]
MEKNQDLTKKYSLSGRVFQKLRDDILSGRYKDHEELREIAVATELGVSRTPVREALRQLELEGLVQIIPNRGAFVSAISATDVHDIYMIRARLEGLCARWATEHISREELEALEQNVYLADFHAARGHMDQMAELDSEFHNIMYSACRSKMLEHLLKDYHQYVLRVRKLTLSVHERGLASNNEHRSIMEAMYQKDADMAEKLASEHIQNAFANMVKNGFYDLYSVNEKETS